MHTLMSLLLATLFFGVFYQERSDSEITFCNLKLPNAIKTANASFNVTYSFIVGKSGHPSSITKIRDDYVGEEEVSSCLQNWRFSGWQRGKRIVVVFRWQHGEGWVELTLSGAGHSQKVKITGDRCPYN